MSVVVFKWSDEDGPNQQVCEDWDEVVEFVRMNQGRMFEVELM